MNCRKCGAKQITRRSAGLFICRHCGIQPGPNFLDRFGNATRPAIEPEQITATDYQIAPRQPRLQAGTTGVSNG